MRGLLEDAIDERAARAPELTPEERLALALKEIGPPEEVYDKPASLFVANFVGSPGMNLVRKDGRTIGVRPEFVRIDPAGEIAGRVVLDEYLGAWRNVHVETDLGRIVLRADPDRRESGNVRLAFDPAHVRTFNAEGRSL